MDDPIGDGDPFAIPDLWKTSKLALADEDHLTDLTILSLAPLSMLIFVLQLGFATMELISV